MRAQIYDPRVRVQSQRTWYNTIAFLVINSWCNPIIPTIYVYTIRCILIIYVADILQAVIVRFATILVYCINGVEDSTCTEQCLNVPTQNILCSRLILCASMAFRCGGLLMLTLCSNSNTVIISVERDSLVITTMIVPLLVRPSNPRFWVMRAFASA